MSERIAPMWSLATTPKAIGATPPVVADFVDITNWRLAVIFAPRYAMVKLDGDAALTIDGGVLWGLVAGKPANLGTLNKGGQIVIADATHCWMDETQDAGVCTGLYVQGTVAGGAATATFVPCETMGDRP